MTVGRTTGCDTEAECSYLDLCGSEGELDDQWVVHSHPLIILISIRNDKLWLVVFNPLDLHPVR